MSELKVNKVSPQSGTDFTLGDSGDTFTVPSGATLTVAGTLTQTGAQTFDGGVDIDNFNINGTTIALSSGNMTIDAQGNDTDIIFKGTDGSADTTFLTIDGSAAGAATFNDKIIATELDISGNCDIDGTTNLDAVDIDGAVQIDNTVTVGVDDTGYDFKLFGATSGASLLWDESVDDLILAGAARVVSPIGIFGADNDAGGTVSISGGDSGASTHADANELVVEKNGAAGISILSFNNNYGNIYFGDGQDNDIGQISYNHTTNSIECVTNTALGFKVDSAGQVTKPLQAYFHVVPASEQSNIANGNTVVWGTETVDTGGNFASNTFTAPVTGVYLLSVSLNVNQFDSSANYVWLNVVTSNRTHKISIHGTGQDADSYYNLSGTVIADMDASDTVTITWEQSGGASQADVLASNSHFYGYLLG